MMQYEFSKAHVCGNDFIVIWDLPKDRAVQVAALAPALCARNTGIGADELVLAQRSGGGTVQLQIFNPDGSEAPMCGNALLAVASEAGVAEHGPLTLVTPRGQHRARGGRQGEVWVELAKARLLADERQSVACADRGEMFRWPVDVAGAPHSVVFETGIDVIDVATLGACIERQWAGSGTTNVMFVEVLRPAALRMRSWERAGTGETRACGSGSVAAAVAYRRLYPHPMDRVVVHCQGGDVQVAFDAADVAHISAPYAQSFTGRISL